MDIPTYEDAAYPVPDMTTADYALNWPRPQPLGQQTPCHQPVAGVVQFWPDSSEGIPHYCAKTVLQSPVTTSQLGSGLPGYLGTCRSNGGGGHKAKASSRQCLQALQMAK
jgi:hypothetical protein